MRCSSSCWSPKWIVVRIGPMPAHGHHNPGTMCTTPEHARGGVHRECHWQIREGCEFFLSRRCLYGTGKLEKGSFRAQPNYFEEPFKKIYLKIAIDIEVCFIVRIIIFNFSPKIRTDSYLQSSNFTTEDRIRLRVALVQQLVQFRSFLDFLNFKYIFLIFPVVDSMEIHHQKHPLIVILNIWLIFFYFILKI